MPIIKNLRPDILTIQEIIHRAALAINAKRANRSLERHKLVAAGIALDPKRIKPTSKRPSPMHPASQTIKRNARPIIAEFKDRPAPKSKSPNGLRSRNPRLARKAEQVKRRKRNNLVPAAPPASITNIRK
jgi:hypothetical protein